LDKQEVTTKGTKISSKLGHKFIDIGESLESRIKQCGERLDDCMVLLTSDDEPIGSTSWTNASTSTKKKTFASVYVFRSFQSRKNKKEATALLNKVQAVAKDAYLKVIDACACE
jgi:hypothetical protein